MSEKKIIPIGPYHPLQEEPELFKLYCEGEIVRDIKWETGYNHRGIEKLSEQKTFDQVFLPCRAHMRDMLHIPPFCICKCHGGDC
jgi:Ni,Fe-hydrogenase III large subunit